MGAIINHLLEVYARIRQRCTFASLSLRFKDRPVDLAPPFKPGTFTYVAYLDFDMDSFSVDAVPKLGCSTDQVPNLPLTVGTGGSKQITVFAKDPKTNKRQPYNIRVTRL